MPRTLKDSKLCPAHRESQLVLVFYLSRRSVLHDEKGRVDAAMNRGLFSHTGQQLMFFQKK